MNILRPTREPEIGTMLWMLGSALQPRSAVYVSSPITTGRRLLEFHAGGHDTPFDGRFETDVLEPNLQYARSAVGQLRKKIQLPVIDPTAVPALEGWTQDDYRFLWGKVIHIFARQVVFLDGWQYSSGCCYEYLVAYTDRLPSTEFESGNPIELAEAVSKITVARRELGSVGSDTSFISSVLLELERLAGESAANRGSRVQG